MRISFEGKISIALALLGLLGAGALMVFPHQLWIGWAMMGASMLGLLILWAHHVLSKGSNASPLGMTNTGAYAGRDNTGTQQVFQGPVTIQHTPSPRSGPEFEEIQKINALIGSKDEMALRRQFDIPDMLEGNIILQRQRISLIKKGEGKKFVYGPPYTDGGDGFAIIRITRFQPRQNSIFIESDPNGPEVIGVATTLKYRKSTDLLVELINSILVPDKICNPLRDFSGTISRNSSLMIDVLNEMAHESFDNFTSNNNADSPHFKKINHQYWSRFEQLKPKADAVILAIKEHWMDG
jgi:hypothetical protein